MMYGSMPPEVWAVWPTVHLELSRAQIQKWKSLGYKVAVLVNPPHCNQDLPEADMVVVQSEWKGFPLAANVLCAEAHGDIVAVVGDDVFPDPHRNAQEIGEEFQERFPDLFGVMQPTGDKYGCWDRCAVSPWIGRKFINEAYGGIGPYWPGYYHYFSDEELQAYAEQLGVFQQREDLCQYHDHWQREKGVKRPKHLRKAKLQWSQDRWTFKIRKAKGFPHEFDQA